MMNNVQDMFSALFKPFNRSTSMEQQRPPRDRSPVTSRGQNDVEDDDFLLVGQTRSERTTVYASQFRNDVDRPPGYERAISIPKDDQLPSYAEYSKSQEEYSLWMNSRSESDRTTNQNASYMECSDNVSGRSNQNSSLMDCSDNHLSMTAVGDIPFSLSPELQLRLDVMKCTVDPNLIQQGMQDLSKYDYDFSLELSILSEHEML